MVHKWLLVCDGFRLKPIWGGQTVFNPKGKVCPCQGGNDLPLTVGLARLTALNESFSTFEPTEYHNCRHGRFGKATQDGASLGVDARGDPPDRPLPLAILGSDDEAGPATLSPKSSRFLGQHRSAGGKYWNGPSRSHIP
jgi:hypothetical protein